TCNSLPLFILANQIDLVQEDERSDTLVFSSDQATVEQLKITTGNNRQHKDQLCNIGRNQFFTKNFAAIKKAGARQDGFNDSLAAGRRNNFNFITTHHSFFLSAHNTGINSTARGLNLK